MSVTPRVPRAIGSSESGQPRSPMDGWHRGAGRSRCRGAALPPPGVVPVMLPTPCARLCISNSPARLPSSASTRSGTAPVSSPSSPPGQGSALCSEVLPRASSPATGRASRRPEGLQGARAFRRARRPPYRRGGPGTSPVRVSWGPMRELLLKSALDLGAGSIEAAAPRPYQGVPEREYLTGAPFPATGATDIGHRLVGAEVIAGSNRTVAPNADALEFHTTHARASYSGQTRWAPNAPTGPGRIVDLADPLTATLAEAMLCGGMERGGAARTAAARSGRWRRSRWNTR